MAVLRVRNRVGSYLPFVILGALAVIAVMIGKTLGVALTIFAVLVWAVVGLTIVYMILFRNVKFKLWSDDEDDGELVAVPDVEVVEDASGSPTPVGPADVPVVFVPVAPVAADVASQSQSESESTSTRPAPTVGGAGGVVMDDEVRTA